MAIQGLHLLISSSPAGFLPHFVIPRLLSGHDWLSLTLYSPFLLPQYHWLIVLFQLVVVVVGLANLKLVYSSKKIPRPAAVTSMENSVLKLVKMCLCLPTWASSSVTRWKQRNLALVVGSVVRFRDLECHWHERTWGLYHPQLILQLIRSN